MKLKEDKSLFLQCFGNSPQLRVLDFLLDNYEFDYPMTEIARESNVSYNSIRIFFDDFIKNNIIKMTRKVGKSDYYKLNLESPVVKKLMKLDWSLSEAEADEEKDLVVA